MLGFEMALRELERRCSNLVRIGTVAEVDLQRARVRVKMGDALMGFVPFLALRASKAGTTWHAPEVGEQVLVLSREGDPSQGVVIGSIYGGEHPAPLAEAHTHYMSLPETGACHFCVGKATQTIEPNHWKVDLPDDAVFEVKVGNTTLKVTNGQIVVKGASMEVDGDVIAGGVSLQNHTHGGVKAGPSSTGKPQ